MAEVILDVHDSFFWFPEMKPEFEDKPTKETENEGSSEQEGEK